MSALGGGWGVCSQGGGGVSAPRGVSAAGGWGSAPGGSTRGDVSSGGCLLPGVCSRGVSAPGGSTPGGVCSRGAYAPGEGCGIPACTEADTPTVNRMTNRCKILPWPQLRCGR